MTTIVRSNRTWSDHHVLNEIYESNWVHCYQEVLSKPAPNDGHVYCSRKFDNWGCWNDTRAGEKAYIICPAIPGFDVREIAYKDCTENGTWLMIPNTTVEFSNYSACPFTNFQGSDTKDHTHIYVFVGGFAVSIVLLIISLVIFFRHRTLQCERITIHKNLFVSYILTGACWITYSLTVSLNGDVIYENTIWCQVLHVITQYCTVCNFAWMFCEGLYIHTIMVHVFTKGKTLLIYCCVLGWIVLTAIYAGLRGIEPTKSTDCWINESSLQWIIFGPVVASMFINLIFLCNIIRLLVTKLQTMPEASQTKKAARATLILVPLLGLQYLLIPVRPENGSPFEEFYLYVTAVFTSFQGSLVAVMYCFCTGEVVVLMKRRWRQRQQMRSWKIVSVNSITGATLYSGIDQMPKTASSQSFSRQTQELVESPQIEMANVSDDLI